MEPKAMREALKAANITCPVSNKDVIEAYNKAFNKEVVTLASSNIYTYIGQGDEPPHMINFMGRQQFIRGTPTEVTDMGVINKIRTNPCFVAGKVDQSELFARDEAAKKQVEKQRMEDLKLQIEMERVNR